ncbi:hypothetical protein [Cohnella cellulosilytica]|uniref:Uncharacterized protein n=1 Tax=Cohnella cellulosilytica TaxID=986710 RepID=A0ABW2FJC5_9BACL
MSEMQEVLLELRKINGRIGNLEDKFDSLENRFDTLEGRFDTLENRFDTLEKKVDRIDSKLDEYHLENIAADEKLLSAIQLTNERLDYQRARLAKAEEDIHLLQQR